MILDRISLEDLPRLREWKQSFSQGRDFTLLDFLYSEGNLDLAVAFAELFFPKIVIVNGCHFREQAYLKSPVSTTENMSLKKKQQAEHLVNHLHIYDLFLSDHVDTKLEVEGELAKLLLSSWAHALKAQFPETTFSFDLQTEPEAYGPTITFWQS